tara:strand:+ start:5649 stop:6998 length:1350 start_codon:yes stop_codon:yes gene_type:complete
MFYIIESPQQINLLLAVVEKTPCFVEVVSSNDLYHPKLTTTVAVYIRPVGEEEGYIIPIQHSECINIEKDRIYELLKKALSLYTLNKKTLLYHFNLQEAIDISLLYSMKYYKRLEYKNTNNTIDSFYRKYESKPDINTIVPISKIYQRCETIYESIEPFISEICITNSTVVPTGFDFYNNTATNVFFLIEQNGIGIIEEDFNEVHKPRNPIHNTHNSSVYSLYNLYNATSRPTNNFNSVNFAAINKSEEYRKCFKPKNEYFVEFDFDGYHLRLLSDQIKYPLTEESAHKQLAKNYFDTDNITEEQYNLAKQINFQAIYGKIPDEHSHLPIFKSIQSYIDGMWEMFEKEGYVTNPQSGKPFTKELKEMHPAKLMNYMMQSLETSNNITILKEVLRYLQDKKTFITLYTYDAILFDFSKEDGKSTLEDIKNIMEGEGKYPVKFKYSKDLML